MKDLKHPIAFVFSGGASLGALQVGMIKAVFEEGLRPDFMVGTSAGAINAAWLAEDFSNERISELENIWKMLRTHDVFPGVLWHSLTGVFTDLNFLASSSKILNLIEKNLQKDYRRLKIPAHFIATDLLTGAPVTLSMGDLHQNVLASAAIPGIFPSVTIDGRVLVDGALSSHIPIQAALELGAKTIVIFDSSYPCQIKQVPTKYLPRLMYTLTILLQHQARSAITTCRESRVSVIYLPSPCPISVLPHDFSQAAKLIDDAYSAVKPFLKDNAKFKSGVIGQPHRHYQEFKLEPIKNPPERST